MDSTPTKPALSPAVLEAARWLEARLRHIEYGAIAVELTVHDGKITRVERSESIKVKVHNDEG